MKDTGPRLYSQYHEKQVKTDKNYYDQYLFFIQCEKIRIRISEPYKKHLKASH
jgi:hypothetical protein